MPSLPIIEHFQPLKDRCPCLIMGPEAVLGQEFALQGGEKALHHGVVEAVPHRPIDERMPAAAHRSPKRTEVYWQP